MIFFLNEMGKLILGFCQDMVVVQTLPMLVSIPGSGGSESGALDVGCGSRHTVVLTKDNHLWAFGEGSMI
jgi:alpha-tubulin suppressor-like RCC1 family protein